MMKTPLISDLINDTFLGVMRTTLIAIKQHESYTWEKLDSIIGGGGVNVLINFVRRGHSPHFQRLHKYVFFIEGCFKKNPNYPPLQAYTEFIGNTLGSSGQTNRYSPFKEMLNLSEEEQSKLSQLISGNYYAVRRSYDNRYVVAHVNIADTYEKFGLPICRATRRRLDGGGDFSVDGSVWKKNQHIHMTGYENISGNTRSMYLTPVDEKYMYGRGLTSGIDGNGIAFSAKVLMVKTQNNITYKKGRFSTGVFESKDETLESLVNGGVPGKEIEEMIEFIHDGSHIHVLVG